MSTDKDTELWKMMGKMPIFQWNRFCIVSVKILFYENPCYCFLTEIYEGPLAFCIRISWYEYKGMCKQECDIRVLVYIYIEVA